MYKPNEKKVYTNTQVTNIPKKTDSKYHQPGYTACLSEHNSLYTQYKRIKPEEKKEDKAKVLKLSDLHNEHPFSKKNPLEITHNSDLQLRSNSRRPVENKSSTFQSSYSIEDKQISNKRFESIEEKYFNIISILQSSKKDMRLIELTNNVENPFETVTRVDEREIN
jgi:hypothetical protein